MPVDIGFAGGGSRLFINLLFVIKLPTLLTYTNKIYFTITLDYLLYDGVRKSSSVLVCVEWWCDGFFFSLTFLHLHQLLLLTIILIF